MPYTFLLVTSLTILLAVLLSLYRVVAGPSIIDRIIGVNVVGTKTIAVIVLTGYLFDRVEFFIDIAFLYALINFIGTLAFSRYFEQKGVENSDRRDDDSRSVIGLRRDLLSIYGCCWTCPVSGFLHTDACRQ